MEEVVVQNKERSNTGALYIIQYLCVFSDLQANVLTLNANLSTAI